MKSPTPKGDGKALGESTLGVISRHRQRLTPSPPVGRRRSQPTPERNGPGRTRPLCSALLCSQLVPGSRAGGAGSQPQGGGAGAAGAGLRRRRRGAASGGAEEERPPPGQRPERSRRRKSAAESRVRTGKKPGRPPGSADGGRGALRGWARERNPAGARPATHLRLPSRALSHPRRGAPPRRPELAGRCPKRGPQGARAPRGPARSGASSRPAAGGWRLAAGGEDSREGVTTGPPRLPRSPVAPAPAAVGEGK